MNVAVLGDFSANLDEGYKNTSHYLSEAIESYARVTRLNVKQMGTRGFWQTAARVRPDVLHVISQPTRQGLVFAALLSALWPGTRVVISALRPQRFLRAGHPARASLAALRLARPRLLLVQDGSTAASLGRLGIPTRLLANGVDLERFRPVPAHERLALRERHGLAPDRPVALHVGHLEVARNLIALRGLPRAGVQVVVAGSVYMGVNQSLVDQLRAAGFRVLQEYQPRVEELYQLADLYVFPPRPGDSLAMPLSVLEAMACNLPVVTTRFAGLTSAFEEAPSFQYADADRIAAKALAVLASRPAARTREMVTPYSWASIARRLHGYYEQVLG